LGFWRGTMRYQSRRRVAPELLEDLRQVAIERPRFGYRRLHVMLKRKGWTVNRKPVLRLVRENGWLVRRKLRKKLAAVPRIPTAQPPRPDQAWAMDFVFDGTAGGRTFRTLNVIDRFTGECLVIEVDTSMTGQRVVAVLALMVAMRGKPQSIGIDNGPGFISKVMPGRSSRALRCNSFAPSSRPRTAASRASMEGSGTNA
jgi:putative transposase